MSSFPPQKKQKKKLKPSQEFSVEKYPIYENPLLLFKKDKQLRWKDLSESSGLDLGVLQYASRISSPDGWMGLSFKTIQSLRKIGIEFPFLYKSEDETSCIYNHDHIKQPEECEILSS